MRLLKYKVNKFRSIKGTEWIEIDQLTCFVGTNEAGKTNLLLPLWKFNPADKVTKIDLLLDYPRDEYSKVEADDGARKNEMFIEVLFELDQGEKDSFTNEYNAYLNSSTEKEGEKEEEKEKEKEKEEEKEKIKTPNFLLIQKDYHGHFYIYSTNESGEKLTDDFEDMVGEDLFNKICQWMPKFVYYSEYGNLDSKLHLPRVREDLARISSLTGKELMRARTLKILFGHLDLNPEEILTLGQEEGEPHTDPAQKSKDVIEKESRNKQERYAKVESAASNLTEQFKEWWSQGNYIFHFNADGQYFRILVSDDERPSKIELESRSKGLQWFFSFFLVFLAESKGEHRDCILLLDEPGLNLHPNAQTDLIKFFNQLSEDNQLIYTTHLPFLVDHNNLDRVKAVYTEKGLTKVSNDLNKADKEKKAIQPVNAAIGITASHSLLVGCTIVIVEGISDQLYLTLIKNYLISKKKFTPKKELVFIPVSGVAGIKPVVSIIYGSTSELPISLLDSDNAGKQFQESLKQGLYSNDQDKVIETDTFTDRTGSEIEDLMPTDLLIDSFDRLFRGDREIEDAGIKTSAPIVPQLKKFAKENEIDLEVGWKVELGKRIKQRFKGEVDEKLEGKWKDLFDKLQRNFNETLSEKNTLRSEKTKS